MSREDPTPQGQVPPEWSLPLRATRNKNLSHFSGSKRNVRGSREQQGQQGTAGSLRSHEVMSSAPRRPEAGALQGLAEPGVLEEPQRARVAVTG